MTFAEVDGNFTALNDELGQATSANTAGRVVARDGSGDFAARAVTAERVIVNGNTPPVNGIFRPAANTVGIATNSTERFRIGSTGQADFTATGATGAVFTTGANGVVRLTDGTVQVDLHVNATGGKVRTASNHPLLFGTNSTERMRISAAGVLLVGTTATPTTASTGTIVAQNRTVIGSTGAGTQQVYAGEIGSVTATTGTTVFRFRTTQILVGRPCYVRLAICSRSSSNTPSNNPTAEYAFQLHQTSGTVCTLNGATTIFETGYVRATHFSFADLGNGECTVTMANPTALALTGSYRIEILSPAGFWTLDNVSVT